MLNSSDYAKNYASTIGKSLGGGLFENLRTCTHRRIHIDIDTRMHAVVHKQIHTSYSSCA